MKNLLLGLLLAIMNTQFSFAQNSANNQQIIALSKQKWQWMAEKNISALNTLFDQKSMFVHMGGSWGKEQELNVIESGGIHYKRADIHDVSVQILDNTAGFFVKPDHFTCCRRRPRSDQ